jgi:hypothetical protein
MGMVYMCDDLDRHVDQALAEDKANAGLGLRKEGLECGVEGGSVVDVFFESAIGDGFY